MHAPFGLLASIQNVKAIFTWGLWLSGAGHFCVLVASFQVPYRLHWSEDLRKLAPFNRKLMWVYGAFTALTIIAFGVLTFVLHGEMLRGDRAAMGLATFIGFYWASRIAVDFLYFDHQDWPKDKGLVIGHVLLTLLFSYLAASNLLLVAWTIWGRR